MTSNAHGLPPLMTLKNGRYYYLQPKQPSGRRWISLSRVFEEALVQYRELTGHQQPIETIEETAPKFALMSDLRSAWSKAQKRARESDILFTIHADDVVRLAMSNNWRCAMTNLPFDPKVLSSSRTRPYMPSVDRINSRGGYTPDNCRVVCSAVNFALNEWGEGVLAMIATAYVRKNPAIKLVRNLTERQKSAVRC